MMGAPAGQRQRCERGFSLIELTITLGLLLLVVGTLAMQLTSAQRTARYGADRAAILDETRASMARMTKDLRQASAIDPGSDSDHLVLSTYVLGVAATVTYDISGATLRRTVAGRPAEILQTHLASSSIFSYSPDTTATETVGLLLEVIPPASPDATIQLTSEIHLRNF